MKLSAAVCVVLVALWRSAVANPLVSPFTARQEQLTCQDYADGFRSVVLGTEGEETCYDLIQGGNITSGLRGTVCVQSEEQPDGTTCIRFSFEAVGEDWDFTRVEAGVRQGCELEGFGDNPIVVSEVGEFVTKTVEVCLDTFEASPGTSGEGCCNDTVCIYASVRSRRVTSAGTTEFNSFPRIGASDCATRGSGPSGKFVGCALPLTCEDPVTPTPTPPVELPCQDYADEFSSVVIGNEENQTCFQLRGNGSPDGVRVGTLCLRIVEIGEKTCVAFAFIARKPWEFRGAEAGLAHDCADENENIFQVAREGPFTFKKLFVCLNKFSSPPGVDNEGCCNHEICAFSQVSALDTSNENARPVTASPQAGGNGCEYSGIGDITQCSVPLICTNPPPGERPCQEYADEFSSVVIRNEDNQTCFQLRRNGSFDGVRVGILCLRTVEIGEKTCVAFAFIAHKPWEFRGAEAGLAHDCADENENIFQVAREGPFTFKKLFVCLNKFSSPPGVDNEGCCNHKICAFSQVSALDTSNENAQPFTASPRVSGSRCNYVGIGDITQCNVPLVCT